MALIPDWKPVLKRAWSVKFLALSGILAGCETVLQISGVSILPPAIAPAVIGVLSALGILARVLAQKEAEDVAK